MKNFYQSGRSMIEMLGVLAIVGILSVGGFNLVNKMQTSSTINEVLDEVSTLASKVRTVARDYEGTSGAQINSYVKKAKAVPDTFLYTEDESNPDNISFTGAGDVDYSIYYIGSPRVLFSIKLENVSTDICMQIATNNWGGPSSSGFRGIAVNMDAPTSVDSAIQSGLNTSLSANLAVAGHSTNPAPMGIGTATDTCGNTNTIIMSFR